MGCSVYIMQDVAVDDQRGAKGLRVALGITLSFFVVELIGGFLTNSLALQTDAWHMLSDVLALSFAVIAARLAQKPTTVKRTYGYYRSEVLAAFLNGVFLWAIVVFIIYEAIQRIQHPAKVEGLGVLIIASFGLIANGVSAATLSKSRNKSLNVKGAFLHVVADALGSIGAISAGLIMLLTGWYQADSLISIMIGALVFYSSGKLVRESVNVLLEGVPAHIDLNKLESKILQLKGVQGVHDLHVWCVTPDKMCCMSGHVVVKKGTGKRKLISALINMLREEFGIDHTTIQMEDEGYPKAINEH